MFGDLDLYDLVKEKYMREALIDSICHNEYNSDYRDTIEYVIDNKLDLFIKYNKSYYDGDEKLPLIILSSIGRIWAIVYKTPPNMLKDKSLEVFKLIFDVDEYLDFVLSIIDESLKAVECFIHLDRSNEALRLIVDSYVARNFQIAYNEADKDSVIKKFKRGNRLKKIINRK